MYSATVKPTISLFSEIDIDVLDPNEFRATYFAEPHIESFPAAAGQMSLSHFPRHQYQNGWLFSKSYFP
jgi:hypothetical protein